MLRVIVSKQTRQVTHKPLLWRLPTERESGCMTLKPGRRYRCSKAEEKKASEIKAAEKKNVAEPQSSKGAADKTAEAKEPVVPPPPRKARWGLRLMFLGVGFVGGTIGACYYDPEARKLVEENVPYSDQLLLAMFGPSKIANANSKPQITRSYNLPIEQPAASVGSTKSVTEQAETPKVDQPQDKKSKAEQDKADIERKINEQREDKEAQNKALELSLQPTLEEASRLVNTAVGSQKSAAQAVLEHVDKVRALMDGVTSEEDGGVSGWKHVGELLDAKKEAVASAEKAYDQVSRRCKRVALIDERGGSLVKYLLSYLQSLLVLPRAFPPAPASPAGSPEHPPQLDTFHVLHYTQQALDEGDLEQAARYMNQLRGEPRRVARDWLQEARWLLEVRQLARVLAAHATATHITSVEDQK